jgi:NhaP-type Na+/H+ or K+/H+ antiporter
LPHKKGILAATYAVVLFTVIVQGGSVGWLIEHIKATDKAAKGEVPR